MMAHLDPARIEEIFDERTKADQERYDRWIAEHGHERQSYRRAVFFCSPDVLTNMGSGRFEVIARPLPRDARRVATFYSEARDQFAVVIESSEFEPIYEGEKLPILDPMVFKKLRPGDGVVRRICSLIWDFAESRKINLGPLAPWIFGGMIGRRPRRVK